jgi:hypothetical protein
MRSTIIISKILLLLAFQPLKVFSVDAPVTTIGTYTPCPGTTVLAVVSVTNFTAIGSLTLRIEYDSTVMTFNPPPATIFNPLLGGANINSTPAGGTLKKLMITWSNLTPLTLPAASTLVTLSFGFINGNSSLAFNNTSGGGGDCEYANATGIPLNDLPTSSFYFNGQVNSGLPAQPSPIVGPTSPCEAASVSYSVTNVSGVSYAWTVPSGWVLTAGQGTSSITTTVGPNSGTITVAPSGPCGTGNSQSAAITVLPLPGTCGTINGPQNPCLGSAGLTYSVDPVPNATGYLWTVPATWSIVAGQNTSVITVNCGTLGGTVTATASNPCGNSNTSVLNVMPATPPVANAGPNQSIPYGSSTTLNGSATGGSGNYSWHWEPAALLINPNIQHPVTVNLTSSVQFTLSVTDQVSGCAGTSQMIVTVTGGVLSVDATADPSPVCEGNPVQLLALASGGTGNYSYTWSSNPPGFVSTIPNPVVIPTVTTWYKVVVYDGFATLADSVLVTVSPLPGTPAEPTGPDTVDLQFVTTSAFTTDGTPHAISWFWELTPPSAGSVSGTGNTCLVTWNPNFLGTAHVRVKGINSCGESPWSDEKLTLVDNTTSVQDNDRDDRPLIFPNPNKGVFTIRGVNRQCSQIDILDHLGRLVYSKSIGLSSNSEITNTLNPNGEITVDLRSHPRGMYLLLLRKEQKTTTTKFLVN